MDTIMSSFNVKALQNLASYPNRSQHHAQAALARGRAPLTTATNSQHAATPPGNSYTTVPDSKESSDLPSEFWEAVAQDPTILRGADFSSQARARAEIIRQNGKIAPPYPLIDTHRIVSKRPLNPQAKGYITLSSGPGAPPPLQAGPPGHRHYTPSTLEGASKALREDTQTYHSADQLNSGAGFHDAVSHDRLAASILPSRAMSPDGARLTPATGNSDVHPIAPPAPIAPPTSTIPKSEVEVKPKRQEIIDTLSPEEALKYYPKGFPPNYVHNVVTPISSDWTDAYPIHCRLKTSMSPEEKVLHDAKLDELFYAGSGGLRKTMDDTIRDAERRVYGNQYGAIGQEREHFVSHQGHSSAASASDRGCRAEYPPLSIEDVNGQETSDASEPLLNMTFEMLLSYMEDEGRKCVFSRFDNPDEWMIDYSADGPKSFYGDVKKKREKGKAPLHK
ncbi:hypothetical protein NKR23_g1589 [Pleurostoma richardsiae]|uniref:Uncharacterized protein n=1 Tax=Pleurostoma richardsiae TaxID=41990 RepID=A0AA38VJA5_9PEZI|nr:hypothetical protein NKR23_g1589 [Pleurostoma richardsiae]